MLVITQSAVNHRSYEIDGIFRDYTPSYICYNLFLYKKFYRNKFTPAINFYRYTPFRYFSESSYLNQINNSLNIIPVQSNTDKFSYYLTGLIEGDGTIVVPKVKRTKARLNYPCIQIVFNLKDLPLALLIQKQLKHGSLSKKKGANAYILTINNYKGLLLLISLINGKMKTPKIYCLHKLIDWYNIKDPTLNIEKKSLNMLPIEDSAWLSGFIDADGHFSVRTTLSGQYPKIECKFELSQRQIDHNGHDNLEFLQFIAKYLNTEVKKTRVNKQYPQYRVRTVNLKGNISLENYLNSFPLYGSKHLDYLDWLKVVDLFKMGKFNHKLNMKNVQKIKLNMNDKRTIFIWDHLNKFYNLDV